MSAKIVIVVAVADNGVIGREGVLPWRMPSDLKRFRTMTMGKPVIMGRKTFQGLKKPLDGRDNIVVTRNAGWTAPGAIAAPTLEAAIALARDLAARRGADEIAVIGGGEIYRAALPLADRIYLTRVHATPTGDTFFLDPDPRRWHRVSTIQVTSGPPDDYSADLLVFDKVTIG